VFRFKHASLGVKIREFSWVVENESFDHQWVLRCHYNNNSNNNNNYQPLKLFSDSLWATYLPLSCSDILGNREIHFLLKRKQVRLVTSIYEACCHLWPSINDVTVSGKGIKYLLFVMIVLSICYKMCDDWDRGSKIALNYATSFMVEPFSNVK